METISVYGTPFHVKGRTTEQISRELRLARNAVRSIVRGEGTERLYEGGAQPLPALGALFDALDQMLADHARRASRSD